MPARGIMGAHILAFTCHHIITQALREGKQQVILTKDKKTWCVDLKTPQNMKQYPVPQQPFQFKWRHVRRVRRDLHTAADGKS